MTRLTSRERPKSAPYLRLKKGAKGVQSVKVFSSTVPKKSKNWTEVARQGDPLRFFIHSVANHQTKKMGDPLVARSTRDHPSMRYDRYAGK